MRLEIGRSKTNFCVLAVIILLLLIVITVSLSLWRTDGLLVYTLDDPYIHLSVAENILKGGYGINTGEFASPSSSIIYPILLAIALFFGMGNWGPFVINLAASLITAWLMASLIWKYAVDSSSWSSVLRAVVYLPFYFAALNLVALPLTGMEHTLHLLLSVCVIAGLAELQRDQPPSALLLVGVFFAPLVRFEGFALSAAALFAILYMGHYKPFTVLTTMLAAILVFYASLMTHLGLPVLPSSVLVKSNISQAVVGDEISSVLVKGLSNIEISLKRSFGIIFGGTVALLLIGFSRNDPASRWRHFPMIVVLSVALAAHVIAGRYGVLGRYEVYAVAMCLTALTIVFGDSFKDSSGLMLPRIIGVVILLIFFGASYHAAWWKTPSASENIYVQHYQMHKFATDFFPKSVAVNDIGWVSYRNDAHVLDLWGLASENARETRAERGFTSTGISRLVADSNAVYAMIYDEWFVDAIPTDWCKIAVLITPQISSSSGEVTFYLIDDRYRSEMENALGRFQRNLHEVTRLERFSC